MKKLIFVSSALVLLPSINHAASILIDDFSVAQGPYNTDTDFAVTDPGILGGQRDLSLVVPADTTVTADVAGGSVNANASYAGIGGLTFGYLWLTYDGIDADSSRFGNVTPGLGGADILNLGPNTNTRFAIALGEITGDALLNTLTVVVNASNGAGGNIEDAETIDISVADSNTTVFIDYSQFDSSVDFSSINYLQLNFSGSFLAGDSLSTEVTSFTAIPEPSTALLVGLSGFLLFFRRRS